MIHDEPDTWRAATAEPQPIVEYLVDFHARRHDPRTLAGREKLVAAVMPTIRRVTNPTQRDGYLQLLARRSGVEERVLLEELRRPEQVARVVGRPAEAHVGSRINLEAVLASPEALDPEAVARTVEPVEVEPAAAAAAASVPARMVAGRLEGGLFVTTPARELWRQIEQAPVVGFDRAAFVESLDPTLAAVARTLFASAEPLPEDDVALRQAVEQSLSRWTAIGSVSGSNSCVPSSPKQRRPTIDAAAERLRQEALTLQEQRLDLDRRRESTTVLTQRRNPTPATAGSTVGGTA